MSPGVSLEERVAIAISKADMHAEACASAYKVTGLVAAMDYCKQQGIEPPQCSLTAVSANADMLRQKASRMLQDPDWWKKRLERKAWQDFEGEQVRAGKVTNIISDEAFAYMQKKRRR